MTSAFGLRQAQAGVATGPGWCRDRAKPCRDRVGYLGVVIGIGPWLSRHSSWCRNWPGGLGGVATRHVPRTQRSSTCALDSLQHVAVQRQRATCTQQHATCARPGRSVRILFTRPMLLQCTVLCIVWITVHGLLFTNTIHGHCLKKKRVQNLPLKLGRHILVSELRYTNT